ncbi:DUF2540 domain-containing protein [Methanothermococcus sp.]|uniref:DUF2540 domain-containing protein n=1 Tax=Methanothermococcus sp. TaxID=2614238 RepID=UPI0025EA1F53|nr:DUF2540 domain-containing protein [Methanothermococcus sp.]
MYKRFNLYKKLPARKVRFFLHELLKLDVVDVNLLVEVADLPKKYQSRLVLTEEEEEIIKRYGNKTSELLNYAIYKYEKGLYGTENRDTIYQEG